MSNFYDSLTDTFPTALQSHTANTGQSWSRHSSVGGMTFTGGGGKIQTDGAQVTVYKSSWVPAAADYDVITTLVRDSSGSAGSASYSAGRIDAAVQTYYFFGYNMPSGYWELSKCIAGTFTTLATFTQTVAVDAIRVCKLQMRGTAIKGFVDGVERCSVTDSSITAAGSLGVIGYNGGGQMLIDDVTGEDVVTAPALSGNTTMGDYTASGTIAPDGAMSMSGNTTMADYTLSGTIGVGTGTITTQAFKNRGGTLIAAATVIPWTKVIRCSDGATLIESANLVLNGSSQLVITSPLLVSGVKYHVATSDAAGVNFGMQPTTV